MKAKLSLRKKVIIEIISPTIITTTMGIIRIRGKDSFLTDIILFLAVAFYLIMVVNTYFKNFQPEDEMAKRNQQRADSLSFNITMIVVAGAMLYGLFMKAAVVLSITTIIFIFAGMNILNLLLFLFYDIRGN